MGVINFVLDIIKNITRSKIKKVYENVSPPTHP